MRGSARLWSAASLAFPVVLLGVVLVPLAFLLYGSLRSAGPGAPAAVFTFANWQYAATDWGAIYLRNSLVLGLATAAIAVPLGTLLAWIIVRTDLAGRKFFSSVLLVPLLFSPLLTALAWTGLAAPNSGLINVIAREVFGADGPIFSAYSFGAMVMVLALHLTPYVYLAVRPALAAMDREMEDASQVLGAGYLKTFRWITIPLALPAVLGSTVLVFVLAAENFSVIAVLGGQSGFLTIPYGIYESFAMMPSNPTRGSALGLMLLIVTSLGMCLYLWAIRKSSRYITVSGKGGRSNIRRLGGKGKAAALFVIISYILLSIALPYAVLVLGSFSRYFTIENFDTRIFTLQNYAKLGTGPFLTSMRNTLVLTIVGATVAVALGALTGWIAVRGPGRARRIVDYLVTVPVMIPGMALGLGMFWAYLFLPTHLYGTLAILVIAYVTRFMGHGSRIVSSSLMQLSPQFEEAARTLGSTPSAAFRKITLRLLHRALAVAWILIAIFISLEVPASIMLYTGSSMPASVQVFLAMEGGVVSQAFAAGCALATLTLAIILIAQWRFKVFDHL